MLWLVEEEKRYTTYAAACAHFLSCGLLKKRRDIQLAEIVIGLDMRCGLLKKRRDIQLTNYSVSAPIVVAC